MAKYITRPVLILSLVSLLTDVSSEMLYPIMPLYLKKIGFSILLIGILEGFAEAVAGISKGYFGNLSDNSGKRLPFVQWGYFLSSLSKPMLALFTFPVWIFSARTLDRLGKGLRTGARDAMLSDLSSPENKARVFGFHRGMDTLGAALGPLLALVYLQIHPENYRTLFLLAFIPGLLGVACTFLLKEAKATPKLKKGTSFFAAFKYWPRASADYKKLTAGLLVFALFNSSDVFLLLQLKQKGFTDTEVITVYIFYNLVYAALSFPVGILADKIGLKKTVVAGLAIFTLVYAGMALNQTLGGFYVLFFMYGLYAASTEGIAKAWISNISPPQQTATAIGTFAGFNSLAILMASTVAGAIWQSAGASAMFLTTAAITLGTAIYLGVTRIATAFPAPAPLPRN